MRDVLLMLKFIFNVENKRAVGKPEIKTISQSRRNKKKLLWKFWFLNLNLYCYVTILSSEICIVCFKNTCAARNQRRLKVREYIVCWWRDTMQLKECGRRLVILGLRYLIEFLVLHEHYFYRFFRTFWNTEKAGKIWLKALLLCTNKK
jgi:hypothetical protein